MCSVFEVSQADVKKKQKYLTIKCIFGCEEVGGGGECSFSPRGRGYFLTVRYMRDWYGSNGYFISTV